MRTGELALMGGGGGFVEADETFIGREPGKPKKRAYHHKMKVLSLVDRAAGQARSVVVDDLKSATVVAILKENIAKKARVLTDEAGHYHLLRDRFAEHSGVRHRKEEYVSLENPTLAPTPRSRSSRSPEASSASVSPTRSSSAMRMRSLPATAGSRQQSSSGLRVS